MQVVTVITLHTTHICLTLPAVFDSWPKAKIIVHDHLPFTFIYRQPSAMFKKGTKIYSILNFKCPRCHEGDLFPTGSFSFNKPFDMPETCPKCGQKYFLGPGFYYGAMFISYIITAFFCLFFVGGLIMFAGMSVNASFVLLLVVLAILFVWFFRLARAIWININVKYDKGALPQS